MNKRTIQSVGVLLVVLGAASCAPSHTDTPEQDLVAGDALEFGSRCQRMQDLDVPDTDLDIIEAKVFNGAGSGMTADSPQSYCKLTGFFEQRRGFADTQYAIGFSLALPENWNGRFLFQGGGGLNGVIRDPVGALAAGEHAALERGFAVVSTDSGHQSETVFDTRFMDDQLALLNFYSGAVQKVTELSQFIIERFYRNPTKFSYFAGCSTGGREAMTVTQRFPELFDGVIAGAPAMRTNLSEVADLWSAKRLRRLSSEGTDSPFSATQQDAIVDSLLAQCDALDGIADELIMDVAGCDFDPVELKCDAANPGNACLTGEEIAALNEAFGGPKTADGMQVYPGFYFDTGIAAKSTSGTPGLLQAVAGPLGRPRMDLPFDIQREINIANSSPLAPGNSTLTNLSTFAHNGGKLIHFHGVSDPWFSARDTLDYFLRMTDRNGGPAETQRWSRFYFVPGMGHCSGGERALDRFDMLSALVEWVENDAPPERVIATGDSMPDISRPLCPYPKVAMYIGGEPVGSADSFECR